MLSIEQLIEDPPEASIKALEDATGMVYDGNNIDFLYATGKELYQKLYDELHQLHKLDTETFEEYKQRLKQHNPLNTFNNIIYTISDCIKDHNIRDNTSDDSIHMSDD